MSDNILWTDDSDNTLPAEIQLMHDVMYGHITVPRQLRTAYLIGTAAVANWIVGAKSFDEMMDELGSLNDMLTKTDLIVVTVGTN